jgi:hypothetical protein
MDMVFDEFAGGDESTVEEKTKSTQQRSHGAINERILISSFRGVRVRRGGSARASEDGDGGEREVSRSNELHESPNLSARDMHLCFERCNDRGKHFCLCFAIEPLVYIGITGREI